MAERTEPVDEAAQVMAAAVHLKQTAVRAGRPEIAAKADEILALLVDEANPIDGGERTDKGNTMLKILDGLGF